MICNTVRLCAFAWQYVYGFARSLMRTLGEGKLDPYYSEAVDLHVYVCMRGELVG